MNVYTQPRERTIYCPLLIVAILSFIVVVCLQLGGQGGARVLAKHFERNAGRGLRRGANLRGRLRMFARLRGYAGDGRLVPVGAIFELVQCAFGIFAGDCRSRYALSSRTRDKGFVHRIVLNAYVRTRT